jgi:hypothetical protein
MARCKSSCQPLPRFSSSSPPVRTSPSSRPSVASPTPVGSFKQHTAPRGRFMSREVTDMVEILMDRDVQINPPPPLAFSGLPS